MWDGLQLLQLLRDYWPGGGSPQGAQEFPLWPTLHSEVYLADDVRRAACRRTLLPVLSKHWAGLLQGPGPAWEDIELVMDE